jgi:Ca2+-binding EF-hand superfamily protein
MIQALMVVAHKSSTEEIGILRKVFQKYDKKRDGSIGYEDFCSALSEFGQTDGDLREMFEAVDLDGTGKIRYTEFLAATIEAQGAISEERLAEAFDRLDSDDSGKISAENLVEILGKDFPREEINEIIAEADLTKDNHISYAEFLALWEDKHEQGRVQQLRLLGVEVLTGVVSNPEMNSFRGSSIDLYSTDDSSHHDESESAEVLESAEARATFILEKYDTGKHVGFTDAVVAIHSDSTLEQTLLIE